MQWPPELHPKRTQYAFIEFLRKTPFSYVLLMLVSTYILLTTLFGVFYFLAEAITYPDNHDVTTFKRFFHQRRDICKLLGIFTR